MAKPAKPKARAPGTDPKAPKVKGPRSVAKTERCYCGAKVRIGKLCHIDHEALARMNGEALLNANPMFAGGKGVEYVGVPWLPSKIAKYHRLTSHPRYANTLDRVVECVACRERAPWGVLEFAGCPNKSCRKHLGRERADAKEGVDA